jgi:precorrin-6A/cobalt-precorrin-6A reductase
VSVLLLGGTAEARRLAELLAADGVPAVTSLAGVVADGRPPQGDVRIGGFGGVAGLVAYLHESGITAVIDATHPFAAQMTGNAAAACHQAAVPLLRLSRPSWSVRPDAASWRWVDTIEDARRAAERLGHRSFLAIGRQSLGEFAGWTDRQVLVRVVDPPDFPLPEGWVVLRARGPFTLDDELQLLRDHGIDVLVAKDSGGSTEAKLDAAAELGVAVVMVRRPALPVGVDVVTSVAEAAAWLRPAP